MNRLCRTVFAAGLVLGSQSALAWDGIKSGKVSGIDVVSDGENFGFRVYMDGTPMCGTSQVWAFINKSASNYDAVVSTLTAAYLSGKITVLHTMKNGEYCEIGYAMLR